MKVDTQILERTLAYCETHAHQNQGSPERTEATVEAVAWIAELLGDAIKREHPRFNAGAFRHAALPLEAEALKRRILAKIDPA